MNWTGGRLSRSRNAQNSEAAKQRQHFAKMRGKLNDGRPSPPEMQFFDFGIWKPQNRRSDRSEQHDQRLMRTSAPKVKPRHPHVQHPASTRSESQHHKRKRTSSDLVAPSLKSGTPEHHGQEPIYIGSSPSTLDMSSHGSTNPVSKPTSRLTARPSNSHGAETIETKRRRLLETKDWVGIDRPATRPVQIKFTDPKDRDLIGRRRKVSARKPVGLVSRRRPVGEVAAIESFGKIPNDLDQYYNSGRLSVRIGSAVDRSERSLGQSHGTGKTEQFGLISDDILDHGSVRSIVKYSPQSFAINKIGSASFPLSDHKSRVIRTPSAFMEHSSSNRAGSPLSDALRSAQAPTSPLRAPGLENGAVLSDSDWGLPPIDHEQQKRPPGFRLVFEDIPRPMTRGGEMRGSSPITQDFTRFKAPTPIAPAKDRRRPEVEHSGSPDGRSNVNNLHFEDNIRSTSPAAASSEIQTEFEAHAASNAQLEENIERKLNNLEERYRQQRGSSVATNPSPEREHTNTKTVVLPGRSHEDDHQDERQWRSFIDVSPPENTSLLIVRPQPQCLTMEPKPSLKSAISTATDTARPSSAEYKLKDALAANEAEEEAWKKIVFGDLEEGDFQSQTPFDIRLSPDAPARTQPSLVAEIDTSPLKQNPHLYSASMSSIDPMSSASEDLSDSSNAAQDTSVEHAQQQDASDPQYPPEPGSSLAVQASSLNRRTSSPSGLSPRPGRHPISSSQVVQASSAQTPPYRDFSSDPLQWSIDRMPVISYKQPIRSHKQIHETDVISTDTNGYQNASFQVVVPLQITQDQKKILPPTSKVLFKKPTPSIGSRAHEPPQPEVLGGRVLQSGRRIDEPVSNNPRKRSSGGTKRRATQVGNRDGRRYGRERSLAQMGEDNDEILDD